MQKSGSSLTGEATLQGSVVMADITGSTPLYESAGNDAAAAAINARIARMKDVIDSHGGVFISAKGDDVLCYFEDAGASLDAAYAMTVMPDPAGLMVHAGAQWGPFLLHKGDIYGGCVNTAARLCALSKPGEVLLGEDLHGELPLHQRGLLMEISPVRLKGLDAEMRIFSRQVEQQVGDRTTIHNLGASRPAAAMVDARIQTHFGEWQLMENVPCSLGRSEENNLCVAGPSVSRKHATVVLSNGLVEFADHSSAGSFIKMGAAQEFSAFRRSVVLTGEGSISLGGPHHDEISPVIHFRIASRD